MNRKKETTKKQTNKQVGAGFVDQEGDMESKEGRREESGDSIAWISATAKHNSKDRVYLPVSEYSP